jgi:CBS-domain-containing membrane protein
MNVGDCMKQNVVSINVNDSIMSAVGVIIDNHIGTLPVVNDQKKLVGLIQLSDLLDLAMPDFIDLIGNLNFIHNFGALEAQKPDTEILNQPVSKILGEAVSVAMTAGLLRAAAILQEHHLRDLPVVDQDGRLVGIASYVDIGTALISHW